MFGRIRRNRPVVRPQLLQLFFTLKKVARRWHRARKGKIQGGKSELCVSVVSFERPISPQTTQLADNLP